MMPKTIYLSSDFKCHVSNPGGIYTPISTGIFDGKCDVFIEGYRFVPQGRTWAREDGTVFKGEMVAPWKPYAELDAAQRKYEQELVEAARILLGGN